LAARSVLEGKGHNSGHHPGDGFFSPDTMIWRVNREMALLLAGGRALLMQVAHPKVAAGVAEHSHFKDDPLGRLYRTMSTMWSIVFDEVPKARSALERVKNVHRKVQGIVKRGEFVPVGTPYDALDVELLLWVHATLIDSAIVAYDLFVKPMTLGERSLYYEESKRLAQLFEIPDSHIPLSLRDFNDYMEKMLREGEIAVGPTARSLAVDILYPPAWVLRPAAPLFRLLTSGLLPEKLRNAYELSWNNRKQKRFLFVARSARCMLPFVPRALRIVPNARHAEKEFTRP